MMQSLLGWWLFDRQAPAIVHATTGQTIRYLGGPGHRQQFSLIDSGNRKWLLFRYQDAETSYPLLVEWRNVPSREAGRPLVWRVDHVRSAALWRLETGAATACPAYGLWRRVDDCATDALACWPTDGLTGLKPAYIALNGGWFNGTWTAEFYRRVSGSTPNQMSTAVFQQMTLPPLDMAPPAPWLCVTPGSAGRRQMPWVSQLPAELRAEVQVAVEAAPYLISHDGNRALVPLPESERDASLRERKPRLLYTDRQLATDAMSIQIDVHHGASTWSVMLSHAQSRVFLDPASGNALSRRTHTSIMPAGRSVSLEYLPYAAVRLIGHACLDGLLSYPDLEWSSGVRPLEGAKETPTPRQVMFGDWNLAGSAIPSRLEAASHLEAPSAEQRNGFVHMFGETNDGIVRRADCFRTEGFWLFQPAGHVLRNTMAEQQVVYCGQFEAAGPLSVGERAWEFRYEDREIEYPVVVIARPSGREGYLTYVWSIDHLRSAQLWQARTQCAEPPPYGVWRRVNDCVVDALLCWPEVDATGQIPYSVFSIGGWHNGGWLPQFRQARHRGPDFAYTDEEPLPPFLEDLQAPPLSWRFIAAPRVANSADLAGIREIVPGRYCLPAGDRLTGFEDTMPHLRRNDGQAVMFPAGLNSHLFRGEDYDAGAFFLYADANMFFHFSGSAFPGWANLRSSWTFKTNSLSHLGVCGEASFDSELQDGLRGDWFRRVRNSGTGVSGDPSPRAWHRLHTALADGWLQWTGTDERLLDDPDKLARLRDSRAAGVPSVEASGVDLRQKSKVYTHGAYIGGRFHSTCQSEAWLEPAAANDG